MCVQERESGEESNDKEVRNNEQYYQTIYG
jgi:hypothetical protein